MALRQIEEIVNIIKDTDIYEFKWENEKIKLFLSKNSNNVESSNDSQIKIYEEEVEHDEDESEEDVVQQKAVQIKSKMVGTYYSSPVGKNKDFVKRGSKVKKGQVLCIIEAMKVIKEIQSDVDGTILDVYLESGQTVEYGQLIFTIIPD